MQDIKRFVAGGLFMKKKLKRALCAGLCVGTVLPICTGCAEQKPDYTNFEIVLGETVIVAQGEPGKFDWGYVQFPGIYYDEDGHIVATYQKGTDSIAYDSVTCYKISTDGGVTWDDAGEVSTASVHGEAMKTPMPNGKYFAGFVGGGSHTQDYLQNYTPAATGDSRNYGDIKLYFQEDLLNDPAAAEDIKITAREYDPETKEFTTFDVKVNWPYAPVVQMGDMVYPFKQFFALQNHAVIAVGDELYIPIYREGFNSDAFSREEAIMDSSLVGKSHVYLFKSSDNGRTWDYLSMVTARANFVDGLSETSIQKMPDGSFIMVMRTGDANPSQIVRSTDGGYTWTELATFDANGGVMPKLLQLDCGVTLASYGGRPNVYIRGTSDPAGLEWSDVTSPPLAVSSCCYTDMIALDEDTALLIYIDGGLRNPEGKFVKAAVVCTVTIKPI